MLKPRDIAGFLTLSVFALGAVAQNVTEAVAIVDQPSQAHANQDVPEVIPTVLRRVQTDNVDDQVFYAPAGVERMRIDSVTGYVGIGTDGAASPYAFYVKRDANEGATMQIENLHSGAGAMALLRTYSDTAAVNVAAHGSARTLARFGTVLAGWTEIMQWRGNGLILGTNVATPLILGTNNQNRVHITPAGDIGVGLAQPDADVHILSGANTASGYRGLMISQYSNDTAAAMHFLRKARGTLTAPLPVQTNDYIANMNTSAYDGSQFVSRAYLRFEVDGAVSTGNVPTALTIGTGTTSAVERLRIDSSGNVLVAGSITAASVIGSVYQDVAEWVPASSDMEPGTVVVLNTERMNEVMPSHRPYDTTVAGVVSAQPGILLGVAGEAKEKVATTGRVRVKVDATRAPIAVGDLLVTSDKPGCAMRSIPVDVAGIAMHRPGTIIGKAVEALGAGEGEVLVLLSLQ